MKPIGHSAIGMLMLGGIAYLAISAAASAQVADEPPGAYLPPPNQRMLPGGPQHNPRMQQSSPQQQQSMPAQTPAPVPSQLHTVSTTTPPSLLDKPAQPAKIELEQGQLSIHADNSSLVDIMHKLTADAGMTVDGLNKDQRVFGTYGPGDPQQIISDLLDGTGYNVVMLGRTESGTPKQVTLTPRTGATPNGPGGIRPVAMNQSSQDDDVDDEQPQPMTIINPPVEPQQQPTPPPGGGVRTPQQMLQELQQMRQQQGQPQQPPPPQQQ